MAAIISDDGLHRYWLRRDLPLTLERCAAKPRTCTFIMLNPSTADAEIDDPTIRRCIGFADSFGCNGLEVVNLYAYRATDPAELLNVLNPEGPDNDIHLRVALDKPGPLIAAWGAFAPPSRVTKLFEMAGADSLQCLGTTKDGSPRHPLYVRADAQLEPWRPNT